MTYEIITHEDLQKFRLQLLEESYQARFRNQPKSG